MKISVIIPTYNEERNISELVSLLINSRNEFVSEILVVDGGSSDETVLRAQESGAVVLTSPKRGRSIQMNFAVAQSTGDILYFVHADTRPPTSYVEDILSFVKKGIPVGCYRFRFDSNRLMLKVNSYFTRFDGIMLRGGDQTLFVTREVFREMNGFDENHRVMEEYDFLKRIRKKYSFGIIPKDVVVSARKYDNNSWLKVNLANLIAFAMYRCGCSQDKMIRIYYRLLKQPTYEP